MTDSGALIVDSMIRWIPILPFLAAITHGVSIGLLRANLADRSVWMISLSSLAVSFAISATLLFELIGSRQLEPILDSLGPWIGGGVGRRSFSAELTFQFDPLSAVFCVTLTGIALAVYLHLIGQMAQGTMQRQSAQRTFAILDLLVGSTLVLVLADNLLLFFLGWAGVGIASQLFSSFEFEDESASRAGATTFVIGRVGDLGLLAAMLLLFDGLSRAGAPALTFRGIEAAFRLLEGQGILWLAYGAADAPLLLEIVGYGLVLAALTKCAQLPLHFWLPQATGVPIPASALMQSSTTVVAGVYVLLRFSFLLESAPGPLRVLIFSGSATLLLASLAAATQLHLPRLIAFTTSSMLGLVILGMGIGAWSTATFLLLTHAFVKALLLLAAGVVMTALRGETDLRKMGGLAQRMRWTQGIFGLAALGLVGMPPLANFFPIEELLAFLRISERPESGVVLGIAFVSIGILAFALGRAFCLIFWGDVRPSSQVDTLWVDPTGLRQHSLTGLAIMVVLAGGLTPSQFWAELFDAPTTQMDSVGFFLTNSIPGAPDPELGGGDRGELIGGLLALLGVGLMAAALRYGRRGHRGESERAFVRVSIASLREMLYVEKIYAWVLVRPLRWLSQVALVRGVETQLIDRVVVSGGSGLMRQLVWKLLRRIQNGRLQSYTLLGMLTVLAVVTWMVV